MTRHFVNTRSTTLLTSSPAFRACASLRDAGDNRISSVPLGHGCGVWSRYPAVNSRAILTGSRWDRGHVLAAGSASRRGLSASPPCAALAPVCRRLPAPPARSVGSGRGRHGGPGPRAWIPEERPSRDGCCSWPKHGTRQSRSSVVGDLWCTIWKRGADFSERPQARGCAARSFPLRDVPTSRGVPGPSMGHRLFGASIARSGPTCSQTSRVRALSGRPGQSPW